VGRGQDKARVRQLLAEARLVSVPGAGGAGKTRLALQVGRSLSRRFPDGVWLAELAGLADPDLVWHVVGAAVGVLDVSKEGLPVALRRYLRSRRLLLVLDNCEHLAAVCAAVVAELLASCPRLSILATSRTRLGVPGEVLWQVPPLSTPPVGRPAWPELQRYEASRLLEERARAMIPDWRLQERDAERVAELCRRLDGMPLAIELAAARLRVLSVEQIVNGLDNRFSLLTGGSPLQLARHQTLRGTVEWSFNLLPETEQLLWARLSVFAGGFTLEAAEAVAGQPPILGQDFLNALTVLVDSSIVTVEERAGGLRYRMLQSLRQYGAEKLRDASDSAGLTLRHRDWYHALVRAAEADWSGPSQPERLD